MNFANICSQNTVDFGDVLIIIFCIVIFLLCFLPLFFTVTFQEKQMSKKSSIISLILYLIVCPIIFILIKPITNLADSIFYFIFDSIFDALGVSNFTFVSIHFYPPIKIISNGFDYAWLIGLVVAIILIVIVAILSGTKQECDKMYNSDMEKVVPEKYTVITDEVKYSILRDKEVHNFETHTVDNTKYPTNYFWFFLLFSLVSILLTPYVYLIANLIIHIINLCRKS